MAKISKPKALKVPKAPKESASLEVKKRYLAKLNDLKKAKEKEWSDYHKKVAEHEKAKKESKALSAKIKSLRGLGATIKTGGRKR